MKFSYSLNLVAILVLIACSVLPFTYTLAGEDCNTPTIIPHGNFSFTGNTLGTNDDCHFYSFGIGQGDIVYAFTLQPTDEFNCFVTNSSNLVYYVVRDCAEPDATLEDFAYNEPEGLEFYNQEPFAITCFLVIDGYNGGAEGPFSVTGYNGGTVEVGEPSWDGVKAQYR